MSPVASALDEAFERLAGSGFELPNGFVNHGPMACEALDALGRHDDIDEWARRFEHSGAIAVDPVATKDFEWQAALGEYRLLPEWIGYFGRSVDEMGWRPVVATWVPRLLPSLAVALFHGAIRAAHATRAITVADTEARRAELARALAYWAARFHPGHTAAPADAGDLHSDVVAVAATAARRYLAHPDILHLHGITGAMALELFVPHISAEAALDGLAQLRADEAALFRDSRSVDTVSPAGVPASDLSQAASDSGDPHAVKLVEACRRGLAASGDPVFAAAAERVTGLA